MSSSRVVWFILYGYSFLVFLVSVMPVSGPQVVNHQDKIIHFFMYATMAGIVILARKFSSLKTVLLPAFFYAAGFGVMMELIQYFGQ
jgi:VanZ family protein